VLSVFVSYAWGVTKKYVKINGKDLIYAKVAKEIGKQELFVIHAICRLPTSLQLK